MIEMNFTSNYFNRLITKVSKFIKLFSSCKLSIPSLSNIESYRLSIPSRNPCQRSKAISFRSNSGTLACQRYRDGIEGFVASRKFES